MLAIPMDLPELDITGSLPVFVLGDTRLLPAVVPAHIFGSIKAN
jgi:hypothetical protein